ncbi:MAG: DUF1656 domain-containing protein [Pseudomonadota bacterium]|jgi:hypothetical protein
MNQEFDVFGVFLSPVLVSAAVAVVAAALLRAVLVRLSAYRLVWHPALVDTALFVIVWAALASLQFPKAF